MSRSRIAYIHDLTMAAASFLAALYLRLGDGLLFQVGAETMVIGTLVFTGIAAVVFRWQNMYAGIWRYASLNDLTAIARGVSLTILVFLPAMFLLTRLDDLPRSVLVINWFVLMALIGGPRLAYRLYKDRRLELKLERAGHRKMPVLLVGAGDAAELFIRDLQRQPDSDYRAVGLISQMAGRVGRNIHGVPVLGTLDEMGRAVAELEAAGRKPHKVIITKHDLDGAEVRRLLEEADSLGLSLARLPRLTEFKSGATQEIEVRPVNVADLLGRPQTVMDRAGVERLVRGRRVLVTGAGGSIGSELVRQVVDIGPARLTLVEASEYALYTIDAEVAGRAPDLDRAAVIADVRDRDRLDRVFAEAAPEIVFHAAALKHVPLVEANPLEGVLTNTIGTRVVADTCRAHGVTAMVLISTDKAVNPTNVMGSTKRMAEAYCQALDAGAGPDDTRFMTVRFGNVLGSTGSVVPLFQRQLAQGGPLTVTHPEMTRYFMTIREAVELVLQASALGLEARDRHAGKLFVLDMGEPVRIVDLARQMIRLAGRKPDQDVKIVYTGLRPGEKLFEEIFHGAEPPVPTDRDGILVASPRASDPALLTRSLEDLEQTCRGGDWEGALAILSGLVPEYRNPAGRENAPPPIPAPGPMD